MVPLSPWRFLTAFALRLQFLEQLARSHGVGTQLPRAPRKSEEQTQGLRMSCDF